MVVFYNPDGLDVRPTACGRCCAADDAVICHCLQVTATELRTAIAAQGISTISEVSCATGAGSGCTGCHRRLRQMIAEARQRQAAVA